MVYQRKVIDLVTDRNLKYTLAQYDNTEWKLEAATEGGGYYTLFLQKEIIDKSQRIELPILEAGKVN